MSRALERADVDALVVVGGLDAYLTVQEHGRRAAAASPRCGCRSCCCPRASTTTCRAASCRSARTPRSTTPSGRWTGSSSRPRRRGAASWPRRWAAPAATWRCSPASPPAPSGSTCPSRASPSRHLQTDVARMRAAFESGKRLFVAVRNEMAGGLYTTDFLVRLFEEEGHDLFDVRPAVLGHLQQGGNPSPFDRNLATRMAHFALDELTDGPGARRGRRGLRRPDARRASAPGRCRGCCPSSTSPPAGRASSGGWTCCRRSPPSATCRPT